MVWAQRLYALRRLASFVETTLRASWSPKRHLTQASPDPSVTLTKRHLKGLRIRSPRHRVHRRAFRIPGGHRCALPPAGRPTAPRPGSGDRHCPCHSAVNFAVIGHRAGGLKRLSEGLVGREIAAVERTRSEERR